jgi:tRNA(Ile)-lysidine synthetase-like protein
MPPSAPLPRRFAEHFGALGAGSGGAPLLVAVSGGCDSVVLLHLLRFALPAPPHLHAAHFDHAMRPGSAADAAWVRGLCTAWDVPLLHAHADTRLRSETSARDARYRFLRAAAAEVGAAHVVTAHHADDQAETVLFRMLRGTGIDGLAGMRALGPTGIVRPLLPFWRAELAAYARRAGLRWRRDPTNDALTTARNRIRHRLLPDVERSFAPGARRALVRLAEQAREEAEAWEARLAVLAAGTGSACRRGAAGSRNCSATGAYRAPSARGFRCWSTATVRCCGWRESSIVYSFMETRSRERVREMGREIADALTSRRARTCSC